MLMIEIKQTEEYEKWFNSLSDGRAKMLAKEIQEEV